MKIRSINPFALTTDLRTITSDQTVYNTIIRRFLFQLVGMIPLDRNYQVIDLLFVLLGSFGLYLNIFKTEKILQFWDKKILDVRGTSFQRKWLTRVTPIHALQKILRHFLRRLEK